MNKGAQIKFEKQPNKQNLMKGIKRSLPPFCFRWIHFQKVLQKVKLNSGWWKFLSSPHNPPQPPPKETGRVTEWQQVVVVRLLGSEQRIPHRRPIYIKATKKWLYMQIKEQIYANNRTFPYIHNLLPFHRIANPSPNLRNWGGKLLNYIKISFKLKWHWWRQRSNGLVACWGPGFNPSSFQPFVLFSDIGDRKNENLLI